MHHLVTSCCSIGKENNSSQTMMAERPSADRLYGNKTGMTENTGYETAIGPKETGAVAGADTGVRDIQTEPPQTISKGATQEFPASGVKGVDVQLREVIDQKYYTGLEDRPQEQLLGSSCASLPFLASPNAAYQQICCDSKFADSNIVLHHS